MSDLNPPSRSAVLSSRGGRLARRVAGGVVCGGGSLLRRHRYVHSLARSVQSADDGARPYSSSTHTARLQGRALWPVTRDCRKSAASESKPRCAGRRKEGSEEGRRDEGKLLARALSPLLRSLSHSIPMSLRTTARGREGGQAEERASERARAVLTLPAFFPPSEGRARTEQRRRRSTMNWRPLLLRHARLFSSPSPTSRSASVSATCDTLRLSFVFCAVKITLCG